MRRSATVALGLIVFMLLTYSFVSAAPSEHLNWGQQLNAGASSCPAGTLVINVTQKITNDEDSGVAGNYWAFDDYVRRFQVIQTSPGTYCATVSYQGSFTTNPGPSPQNTGTVGAEVVGTFEGGYVSTLFTGTLNPSPIYRTRGSIGTFDYACDGAGNCPGYVSLISTYFSSTTGFDLAWWGWVYHAGNNGSWVNASSGNSGDITGD